MTEMEAREILAQEMEKSAPKVYMTLVHNLRHKDFKLGENTAWPATIAAIQRASQAQEDAIKDLEYRLDQERALTDILSQRKPN